MLRHTQYANELGHSRLHGYQTKGTKHAFFNENFPSRETFFIHNLIYCKGFQKFMLLLKPTKIFKSMTFI